MSKRTDENAARRFLDALFERFEDDYPDAMIEIAFGLNGNPSAARRARLFPISEREKAAAFGCAISASEECHVYVGVGLRKPITDWPALLDDSGNPRERGENEWRGGKSEVIGVGALFADFDEPGHVDLAKAKMTDEGFLPQQAIITGTVPSERTQVFWQYHDLMTDVQEVEERLFGVVKKFDGKADDAVTTFERVMRLPGTISYPKKGKTGRIVEPVAYVEIGDQEPKEIEDHADLYFGRAPVDRKSKGETAKATGIAETGAVDMLGNHVDDREKLMFRTVAAVVRDLTANLGRYPSIDEAFAVAWPQYEAQVAPRMQYPAGTSKADALDAEDRGPREMRSKISYTLKRAGAGKIEGLESVEAAQAVTAQRQQERQFAQFANPEQAARAHEAVKAAGLDSAQIFGVADPATQARIDAREESRQRRRDHLLKTWTPPAESEIAPVQYVYSRFFARGYVSLTVAPPKVGKSLLGCGESVDMASGAGIFNGGRGGQRYRVMYYNAEDDQNALEARIAGVAKLHHVDRDDLVGYLFPKSGVEHDLFITEGETAEINEPAIADLTDAVKTHNLDVLILDPLQDLTSSPETNETFRKLIQRLRKLASELHIAIGIVHHTRKPPPGGSVSSIDDARGGGALRGGARFNRLLAPMTREEADNAGVEDPRFFFRIGDIEGNLAPPSSDLNHWFEKVGVDLGNGDQTGAIVPWEWPDPFEGVTYDDLKRVCREIVKQQARYSSQAKEDWAGLIVIEMLDLGDVADKHVRKRATNILREWEKSKHLKKSSIKVGYKDVPIYVAGPEL